MNTPVFIDPTSDFGFKRLFGSEPNKDLLISFLNAVFRGRKIILDIAYTNTEKVGDHVEFGSIIFDILCRGNNNEQFIIEVQRSLPYNLKQRIYYYGAKLSVDQAPKGNRKDWAYKLHEVYVIVLMDGFVLNAKSSDKTYLKEIVFCNRDTGEIFQDDIGFIYIELVNFIKEESDLQGDLDKWLYVLKHMSQLNQLPLYFRKTIFEKLFNIAQYSKLNKEERLMYDVKLKHKWDKNALMIQAKEEGIEIGKEEGIEIGKEQGFEIGKEEGIEIGKEEGIEIGEQKGFEIGKRKEKESIALRMKSMGHSIEEISKLTGLRVDEIEELKNIL